MFDGGSTQSRSLGRVCVTGRGARDFQSSGNQMTVVMRSDGSVAYRGFNATYVTSK